MNELIKFFALTLLAPVLILAPVSNETIAAETEDGRLFLREGEQYPHLAGRTCRDRGAALAVARTFDEEGPALAEELFWKNAETGGCDVRALKQVTVAEKIYGDASEGKIKVIVLHTPQGDYFGVTNIGWEPDKGF